MGIADHCKVLTRRSCRGGECPVESTAMLNRPHHKCIQLVGGERLFDVVEGAVSHGFDGRCHAGVCRDHDGLCPVRPPLELPNEFHAAHAGHEQVGNDQVIRLAWRIRRASIALAQDNRPDVRLGGEQTHDARALRHGHPPPEHVPAH